VQRRFAIGAGEKLQFELTFLADRFAGRRDTFGDCEYENLYPCNIHDVAPERLILPPRIAK
jgi:hypothetical protein